MTDKQIRKIEMDKADIPKNKRSAFIRYANNWGSFNRHNDVKWYEWGALEYWQKSTNTMSELWGKYQRENGDRILVKQYIL